MDKHERLQLIFAELAAREPFGSHDEALAAIDEAFNFIEDLHSGVPKESEDAINRMRPPSVQFLRETDRDGFRKYIQRKHFTMVGDDGTIEFYLKGATDPVFVKEGKK